ncbi:phosphopantetheine-binding protein [Actinomadura keratinilytica]
MRPAARGAERTLARIWSEVLGVERVGAQDNFFDLGGDSILSMQVVSRARAAGIPLHSKDVFQRQTVAALAAVEGDAPPRPAGEKVPAVGEVPTTPVQHWFFATPQERPGHFDQYVVLDLAPGTDRAALATAVAALPARHDALRTRAVLERGRWVQHTEPLAKGAPPDRAPSTFPGGPPPSRTPPSRRGRTARRPGSAWTSWPSSPRSSSSGDRSGAPRCC